VSAVSGDDFASTARFIAASVEHVRSLTAEQRHDSARRVVQGLRRLGSTIRASQADHGFMAALVLGAELDLIDSLETLLP
jgi:hypothetical protein